MLHLLGQQAMLKGTMCCIIYLGNKLEKGMEGTITQPKPMHASCLVISQIDWRKIEEKMNRDVLPNSFPSSVEPIVVHFFNDSYLLLGLDRPMHTG